MADDFFTLLGKWARKLSFCSNSLLVNLTKVIVLFQRRLVIVLVLIVVTLNLLFKASLYYWIAQLIFVGLLFGSSFYVLIFLSLILNYAWHHRSRFIARAITTQKSVKFILYLRPFYLDRAVGGPHGEEFWYHKSSVIFEPRLTIFFERYAPVLGLMRHPSTYDKDPNFFNLNGHYSAFGAGRVVVRDKKWQNRVVQFVHSSSAILIVPLFSDSTLWELEYIKHAGLVKKCIFAFPPAHSAGVNEEILREATGYLSRLGFKSPKFDDNGIIFTINLDGTVNKSIPFPKTLVFFHNKRTRLLFESLC